MTDPFAAFRLSGRRALVTGADAGIGLAIGAALAGAGARVAINGLAGAAEAARGLGSEAIGIDGDVGVAADLERLIAGVCEAFGGLDILVLNAAVEFREAWDTITQEHLDRQVEVNLKSAYRLLQAFVPGMVGRGWGRVVGIGSIQERKPHPRLLIYAGLKAAQSNIIGNLARQVADSGVTCNVIAPGAIATARNREVLADATYRAAVLSKIPAAAIGRPEDCAGAALLLCSEAGRYITGATIPVDGGMGL